MTTLNIFKQTILSLFCISSTHILIAQTNTAQIEAANNLWKNYSTNTSDRTILPKAIPTNGDIINATDVRTIDLDYDTLKNTLKDMLTKDGGVIKFKNTGVIKFDKPIRLSQDFKTRDLTRTIVIQGKEVVFDGLNKSTLFTVSGNIQFIIQDATFQNANFNPESLSNMTSSGPEEHKFRQGGGAIETNITSALGVQYTSKLRVRNCKFLNNKVSHFKGTGENLNGAGIRLNNYTTGEVFGCHFKNNQAVTGGAIGGTSIQKLTIVDSYFEKNISNGYMDKRTGDAQYMYVVEGAGAIRIDRTIETLEIYSSAFVGNEANTKTSTILVYGRPVQEKADLFPADKVVLNIDKCVFNGNKYHNFRSGTAPGVELIKAPFNSALVFHSGGFEGGKMIMKNTVFDAQEVGISNINMINDFEFENNIFANTKHLNLTFDVVQADNSIKKNDFAKEKSAISLKNVFTSGEINSCTFFNNNPASDNVLGSDISTWVDLSAVVTINKSLFYRTNKNLDVEQVSTQYNTAPKSRIFNGSGNHQFIKNIDENTLKNNLNKVSKEASVYQNPQIQSEYTTKKFAGINVEVFTLCANNVASDVGGLSNCNEATATLSHNIVTEKGTQNNTILFPVPTEDIITIVSNDIKIGEKISINNIPTGLEVISLKATTQGQVSIDIKSLVSGQFYVIMTNHKFIGKFHKK